MTLNEHNLHRVTSITDLLSWVPKLTRLFEDLDGLWEPDLSKEEFLNRLLNSFYSGSFIFLKDSERGIVYVVVIEQETSTLAHFWLFYVNKDFREQTKNLIHDIIAFCKENHFAKIRFSTTRLTSSYDRWVEKFGAKKKFVTYEMEIQ